VSTEELAARMVDRRLSRGERARAAREYAMAAAGDAGIAAYGQRVWNVRPAQGGAR
jgi:hypothetical protein